jgi:hypothetical protein
MLLTEHRGGNQHGDLASRHRDEVGRARCNLGLAEADVATHDPVHRPLALQIGQHLLGRAALVGRVLVREARLELLVVPARCRVGRAFQHLARGVDGEQLVGHVAHRAAHLPLCARPDLAAEPVEERRRALGAGVALDLRQARDGEVELVRLAIADQQELLADPGQIELDQAPVAADAVLGVHQVVPLLDLCQAVDRLPFPDRPHGPAVDAFAEHVLLAHDHERVGRKLEAGGERGHGDLGAARLRQLLPGAAGRLRSGLRLARGGPHDRQLVPVLPQDVRHAIGRGERWTRDADPPSRLEPAGDALGERLQRPARSAASLDLAPQLRVIGRGQVQGILVAPRLERPERVEHQGPALRHRAPGVGVGGVQRQGVAHQPVLRLGARMALEHLFGVLGGPGGTGLGIGDDDERALRQVVEAGLEVVVEQRL